MKISKSELLERELVAKKTNAVYDNAFNVLFQKLPWNSWYENDPAPLNCRLEYLDTYKQYLGNMKLNTIHGLERFTEHHLINGTTQTFDEAYHRYSNRRLRFYRGEYAYHRRIVSTWKFIEDGPIEPNDYVIVSVPHATTGDVPGGFYGMLDDCLANGCPVIVDCAYIGTSADVSFAVDHPAVESVSFSLTKGCGLGPVRSGIRYSNIKDNFPICQQNAYDHTILGAARIGLYFMQELKTPDFIPSIYLAHHKSACADAGLIPTKCMHLAIGDQEWDDFNVDGYNRLGVRSLVKARKQGIA